MERMKEQEGLTSAGAFCPNEVCRHYAKVDEGKIIKVLALHADRERE